MKAHCENTRENASGQNKWKTHIANEKQTIQWKILEVYHRRLDSSQQWSEASRTATHGCIDKKFARRMDGRIDGRSNGRIEGKLD